MTHDNGAYDKYPLPREAGRRFAREFVGIIPLLPQRQDSVTEQLEDLALVATRLGMYDAADFIKAKLHGGPYDHAR